jgi:hypothetical protein
MTYLGQDFRNRKIEDLDNFNAVSISLAIAVKDALGLLGYNRFTVGQIRSDIKNAVQRKKARIRIEKNKKKAICTDIGSDRDGGDDSAAVDFS